MDLSITPQTLSGAVTIPASKSVMHRALICAALAKGESVVENIYFSEDILRTIEGLEALGATISIDGHTVTVQGITAPPKEATIDCGESGSTIRFLIPIAAALGVKATFVGQGKLVSRPLDIYAESLPSHGITFSYDGILPATIEGILQGGHYTLRGDVSSQFITGLLFCLPLLASDSVLTILPPFESQSYVNITIDCLKSFGVEVIAEDLSYRIVGNQQYKPCRYTVESDYSQAAFFLTAQSFGHPLSVSAFSSHSVQGDAAMLSILSDCGADIRLQGDSFVMHKPPTKPFAISAEDIPDLVPILSVLATQLQGISTIRRVARLKLKESDRIASTMALVRALGGMIDYKDDCITIHPSTLTGGVVDCHNDHRIAMAGAIAATIVQGVVTLQGAECVAKSYPTFFEEYSRLGGQVDGINLA